MKNSLPVVAILVSLVAVALSAFSPSTPIAGPPLASPAETSALAARLLSLERKLEGLEERLVAQPVAPGSDAPRRAAGETAARDERVAATDRRLETLEARLAEMQGEVEELGSTTSLTFPFGRSEPELEGSVLDWQLIATSSTSSAEEKLDALSALRFADWEGGDARTHDVVLSMIDLAENHAEAEVRADVWRQLDEVTDPALIDPLLRALALDTHPEVREEAAETLAPFLPDAVVEAALRYAFENDANRDVREQAGESLAR